MGTLGNGDNHFSGRLIAARDAQTRTRFAFAAATVVAVAIIIAEFNSTFSWYMYFALEPDFAKGSAVTAEAQKVLIQEWIKSNRVTISLLGVNIGMSDAAILGSTSLYILSLWFFVSIRRENHLIADLLTQVAKSADQELRLTVFHGIADYLVFTTIGKDDSPRNTLGPRSDLDRQMFYFRHSLRALIFLPVAATVFIIGTDVLSLFFSAPLRFPHDPLWQKLLAKPSALLNLGLVEMIAVTFGVATFFMWPIQQRSATGRFLALKKTSRGVR